MGREVNQDFVTEVTTWYGASANTDQFLYSIFEKERQNSVDKVVILDSPLAGTLL